MHQVKYLIDTSLIGNYIDFNSDNTGNQCWFLLQFSLWVKFRKMTKIMHLNAKYGFCESGKSGLAQSIRLFPHASTVHLDFLTSNKAANPGHKQ